MSFVTTGLLIGGAAAMLVPILIHLLARQRRRPVRWGAMRFLMEALRRHRRRLRLEQWLLLAARCLVLFLFGAALARPVLEHAGLMQGGGSRVVFLVIDNGMVSGARSGTAGDFETALSRFVGDAVQVVEALAPGDRVGVITAARPARGIVVPPSSDHRAVIELLRELSPADSPTDLAASLPILRSALNELGPEADRAVVYLLSGFRAGSAPLEGGLPAALPAGAATTLLAAPAADELIPNVQVTSIEALRGLVLASGDDASAQVTVRLRRGGGQLPRDVTRVRLVGDGLPPLEPGVVQWDPGQAEAQVDFVVSLAGRGEDGGVALSAAIDDDALAADNFRHTVVLSRSRVRVALLSRRTFGAGPDLDRLRAGQWIRRALEPSTLSPIDVVEVDPAALDDADLRAADAAIATRPDLLTDAGWEALKRYVDAGGLLVVTPPGESTVHPWTDRLARGLDLPWRVALEAVEPQPPLGLADEQPASEFLRLLSGDLEDLVRPVRAGRVLPVDPRQTRAAVLLRFADGSPMLIAGSPGGQSEPREGAGDDEAAPPAVRGGTGVVTYLAVSPTLTWTNLPAQPLMVPLFHELIRQGLGLIRTAQRYVVGEQPALGLGPSAATLVAPHGRRIAIGGDGRPESALPRAGLYAALDVGGQRVRTVAANVDAVAGRTEPQDREAVAEWLGRSGPWTTYQRGDPAAALRTAETGASLSGALLLAVLGLLVIETAMARWFSHADVSARGEADVTAGLEAPAGARGS